MVAIDTDQRDRAPCASGARALEFLTPTFRPTQKKLQRSVLPNDARPTCTAAWDKLALSQGRRGPTMRRFTQACFLAVALSCPALAACNSHRPEESQIAALREQVKALSQQLQTLQADTAATDTLDLQSKCAVDAKRQFGEQIGSMKSIFGSVSGSSFVNHYNPNLHRCFVVIHSFLPHGGVTTSLLDANTGVAYATLWTASTAKGGSSPIAACYVTSAAPRDACSSEQRFDQYLERYVPAPSLADLPAQPHEH